MNHEICSRSKWVKGWVYFKDKEYITIETQVWPKHPDDLQYGTHHRNDRVLVICYHSQWNQLEYITKRESVNDEQRD